MYLELQKEYEDGKVLSLEDYVNRKASLKVKDEHVRLIKRPGEIFGDSSQLNEEKFQRSYVITKTQGTRCFEIRQTDLQLFLVVRNHF